MWNMCGSCRSLVLKMRPDKAGGTVRSHLAKVLRQALVFLLIEATIYRQATLGLFGVVLKTLVDTLSQYS